MERYFTYQEHNTFIIYYTAVIWIFSMHLYCYFIKKHKFSVIDPAVPFETHHRKHTGSQTQGRNKSCFVQVELGPGGNELLESTAQEDEERRALDKRKYLALSRRCKEIEQVCVCWYMHVYTCFILHMKYEYGLYLSLLSFKSWILTAILSDYSVAFLCCFKWHV